MAALKSRVHLGAKVGTLCTERAWFMFGELHGQSCKVYDERVYLLLIVKRDDMGIILGETSIQKIPLCLIQIASTTVAFCFV
jgi:hypothetical protein